MWFLRHIKSGGVHNLLVGDELTVGRKDANILIEKDPSISRKHAVLSVTHSLENMTDTSKLPILNIKDAGSKYGTYKNGCKVSGEDESLSDGDTVRFGQFESIFRVCYSPLVITTSCLETAKKKELKKIIQQLGGHFVPEWRPTCTHLVMSDIKITIKAVCCLISQKLLVMPEYLTDLSKQISSKSPEPSVDKYVPPIAEPLINKEKARFDSVPERKTIFKNKTFVFLDKSQFKKLYSSITIGGGEAVHMAENDEAQHDFLLQPGTCVVQPQIEDFKLSQCDSYIREIYGLLYRNRKRMIPESDFGLAVVYCSTEMFCNPDFDIGSTSLGASRLYSQSLTQREVYVPDSLSENMSFKAPAEQRNTLKKDLFKGDLSNQATSSKKRKSDDQDNKWVILSSVDSNPREADDFNASFAPPSKVKKANDFFKISSTRKPNSSEKGSTKSCEEISVPLAQVKVEPSWTMDVDDDMSGTCSSVPVAIMPDPLSNYQKKENHINQTIKEPVTLTSSDRSGQDPSGFLSSRSIILEPKSFDHPEENNEENLSRNLIKIQYMDLICKTRPNRIQNHAAPNEVNLSVKNFKRFRKVFSINARILPQIIGGHELEAYSKQSTKSFFFNYLDEERTKDIMDHDGDYEDDDDCRGEFDWESQK